MAGVFGHPRYLLVSGIVVVTYKKQNYLCSTRLECLTFCRESGYFLLRSS